MNKRRKTRKTTWRCFHCDEVFRSRKAAWAHFGPDDGCEKLPPACIDPLRVDEKERLTELRAAQQYAFECQENSSRADDRADDAELELAEFRKLTGCANTHELRMWMDSQQGRVVTANALIEAVREKAPGVYAEIVQ